MAEHNCADCGGFDVEWMCKCHKHGLEYCRGCSCPQCDEDAWDDYEEAGPLDFEEQLERAIDQALPAPTRRDGT